MSSASNKSTTPTDSPNTEPERNSNSDSNNPIEGFRPPRENQERQDSVRSTASTAPSEGSFCKEIFEEPEGLSDDEFNDSSSLRGYSVRSFAEFNPPQEQDQNPQQGLGNEDPGTQNQVPEA